ncbi:hypothetical protein LCGC14_1354870 [marine sediment metagenome]|uniref:Glycosyltransferase RgtA/B/C/D-like domain-containing protein n=1 Tax=marine sediment metagenome TaxID=412755 RepID=A0A0F9NC47_9ZZZZ
MKMFFNTDNKYFQNTLVVLFFTLVGVLITWPLILKFSSAIYGYPGDPTGTIWMFWWKKIAFLQGLDPDFIPIVGAPLGLDTSHWPASPIIMKSALLLSLISNEIAAYNVLAFLTFPISGLTMYYLVHYLTKNKAASIISGLIYSISPYHLVHGYGHLGIIMGAQWLPLFVLTLFKLYEKRTPKYMIFCATAFSLVLLTNFYDGFFMAVITGAFIVFASFWALKKTREIKFSFKPFVTVIVTTVISAIIIVPLSLHIVKTASSAPSTYTKNLGELYVYSARPWDYLLPSLDNPIFGKYSYKYIVDNIHGSNPVEQTLYLGYIPLTLALLAIALRRKKKSGKGEDETTNFATGFFIFGAFVALWFSVSPTLEIAGANIPMPSYFTYKIVPMFRVYARFGNVALLFIAALAGIGASFLFRRISKARYLYPVMLIIIILISMEFTNIPPYRVSDVSAVPAAYDWLSKQKGKFTIVDYPMYSNIEGGHYSYLFFQRVHKKNLVNGTDTGTESDKLRLQLLDIKDPRVARMLKFLKVKYIVVHPDLYPEEERSKLNDLKALKLIGKFGNDYVYKVDDAIKPLKIRLPPSPKPSAN